MITISDLKIVEAVVSIVLGVSFLVCGLKIIGALKKSFPLFYEQFGNYILTATLGLALP